MRTSRTKRPLTLDGGYILITVAASLLMLMGIAAYVVDLSAIRLDRAADQRITDAAASAGALATFETDAVEGCRDALAYVDINTAGIGSLDESGCTATFSSSCLPGSARELSLSTDRWQITVVNPVPDGHALMNPGQIGAGGYGAAGDDGDPCDRFGVQMTATHTSNFAQVIGSDQGATTVHSVARVELPPPDGVPINLLLLERTERCALQVSGNDAGVIVDAIYNPEDNVIEPGVAAVDSDGSSVTCDGKGVINIEGSNALLRADGPAGCPDQLGGNVLFPGTTLFKGEGCGLIQTVAETIPPPDTCKDTVACTTGGGINPNNPKPLPTTQAERITRAPVDYRYNCYPNYSSPPLGVVWAADPLTAANAQDIEGCFGGGSPAIYNLIQSIGPPGVPPSGVFKRWTTDSGHPDCTIDPGEAITLEDGNWWVDCTTFDVKDTVTFTGGDVVFEGDVNVTSSTGRLTIDNGASSPGVAFMRGGAFTKDSHAHLILLDVTMYVSKGSSVAMAGGGGTLNWKAPNVEGYEFDDLALWSDSTATHFWAGQADLEMSGVFFTPLATADYSGTAGQNQTDAQFIARELHARGNGKLVVAPIFGHAVGIRPPPFTVLIR